MFSKGNSTYDEIKPPQTPESTERQRHGVVFKSEISYSENQDKLA